MRGIIRVLICGLIFVASAQHTRAGGSVAYSDIQGKIPANIRQHLESAFQISEVGDATRLGRHFVNLGGARIGPYQFSATSKVTGTGGYKVSIVTDVEFLDGRGAVTSAPETASSMNEFFVRYEVTSENGNTTPGGGSGLPAGGSGLPGGSSGLPGSMPQGQPQMSDDQAISLARKYYNELNEANLTTRKVEFEKDEINGFIERSYSADGRIRKITMDTATGDHGGFRVEVYTDPNSIPSFVLWEDSYWSFDQNNPNKTIDNVAERRFYFSPTGQLARALEKIFNGSGEQELLKNRDKAKNIDYPADPHGVAFFFTTLNKLVHAGDHEMGTMVNDLLGAWNMMDGPHEEE